MFGWVGDDVFLHTVAQKLQITHSSNLACVTAGAVRYKDDADVLFSKIINSKFEHYNMKMSFHSFKA